MVLYMTMGSKIIGGRLTQCNVASDHNDKNQPGF
jgi:hypothetical protein